MATTWNSADSGAGILLSADLLTASENGTVVAAGNWRSIRGTTAKATGKCYVETTLNALTTGLMVGLMNAGAALGGNAGSDANGIGWQPAYGATYNGGGVNPGTTSAGQVVGMAVDVDARKVWFYNPTTAQWNGAALASQNPATGAGGISIGGISGALFPAFSVYNSNSQDSGTANFGASAFAHPVPSGFVGWDGGAAPSPTTGIGSQAANETVAGDAAPPAAAGQAVNEAVARNALAVPALGGQAVAEGVAANPALPALGGQVVIELVASTTPAPVQPAAQALFMA